MSYSKTGSVKAGSGFNDPRGAETYDLLNKLVADFGESEEAKILFEQGQKFLLEDTLQKNLGIAKNVFADESAKSEKGLSRSLLSRGVSDSGFATSALNAGKNELRGSLYNTAIAKSSDDEFRNKTFGVDIIQALSDTKIGFTQLLANYVQSLLGGGIAGQAANYGDKLQAQSANNQALATILASQSQNGLNANK